MQSYNLIIRSRNFHRTYRGMTGFKQGEFFRWNSWNEKAPNKGEFFLVAGFEILEQIRSNRIPSGYLWQEWINPAISGFFIGVGYRQLGRGFNHLLLLVLGNHDNWRFFFRATVIILSMAHAKRKLPRRQPTSIDVVERWRLHLR